MIIQSKSNSTVKKIISLRDKKYRRQYGEYLVEGIKPVRECINAGKEVVSVICVEEYANEFENAFVVSKSVFEYMSTEKTPQYVMAVVKIPSTDLCVPTGKVLLLDRLQDPGNLGTIIRTANAAGYKDIYLINCTDPFSPKCVRASMSGIFFVNLHIGLLNDVLSVLQGFPLICADMDGENIFEFSPPPSYCLCIGNEGNGLSDEVINQSAFKIKIPMDESCESLNAAISAGIAMYQLKYHNTEV